MDHQLYIAWQTDPVLIGGILALAVAYTLMIGPLRTRIAPGEKFPVRNAILFYIGVVVFYLTEGSPLHDLAERYSLFAHMIQHNVVSYVVAPLMLAGMPVWLLRWLFVTSPLYPVMKQLLKPIFTFLIFTIGYSIWHIPIIYDGALQNSALHHSQHVIFLAVSLAVWWPIMTKVPELPRPHRLVQLVYLFLLPIGQLAVFGAVTFAWDTIYPTYEMAPTWFLADQHQDQTLAGAFMNVSTMLAFGLPFIAIFFRWYGEETGRTMDGRPLRKPRPTTLGEAES